MNYLLLLFTFLFVSLGEAQITYRGFIDKYPIEFVYFNYSDGDARALYSYDKFDTPVLLGGTLKNKQAVLYLKDSLDVVKETFVFKNYSPDASEITGTWTNAATKKVLKVTLTKKFDADEGGSWQNREMLQSESTADHYFRIVISKPPDFFMAKITGVKIFEKGSDRLIQTIPLDCEFRYLENLSTGDFNFDGKTDFSVFEHSYAGANTSSLYILKNKTGELYTLSSFSGSSLAFDPETRTISENNSCCGGTSVMNALYKVVNDEMVLIEKHCFEWNEEADDLVEYDCSED